MGASKGVALRLEKECLSVQGQKKHSSHLYPALGWALLEKELWCLPQKSVSSLLLCTARDCRICLEHSWYSAPLSYQKQGWRIGEMHREKAATRRGKLKATSTLGLRQPRQSALQSIMLQNKACDALSNLYFSKFFLRSLASVPALHFLALNLSLQFMIIVQATEVT